jgi:protein-L-isoaspartate(D-aspartate) O-methyltransferase
MKGVDRGDFSHVHAYMDAPQGIGYGVTISAPHMVLRGFMLHMIFK